MQTEENIGKNHCLEEVTLAGTYWVAHLEFPYLKDRSFIVSREGKK